MSQANYFQHPIKCLKCGLHFIICSDYKEWPIYDTPDKTPGIIHCPECGSTEPIIIWSPQKVEGFIFQAVPGESKDSKIWPEQNEYVKE